MPRNQSTNNYISYVQIVIENSIQIDIVIFDGYVEVLALRYFVVFPMDFIEVLLQCQFLIQNSFMISLNAVDEITILLEKGAMLHNCVVVQLQLIAIFRS